MLKFPTKNARRVKLYYPQKKLPFCGVMHHYLEIMELTFNGKVALVSGAGRGIGRAVALELANDGCKVVCVSRNADSCGKVAEEINASGKTAEALAFDVSSSAECKTACDALIKKYGAIDILVNNAGITKDNLIMRMTDAEWDAVISTNLSSCFYLCRNLVRAMMGKRWGRIVNVSSITGQYGNAGQANYAAAKAGMIGFTKTLARELASRNITANAVAPGFIETDMTSVLPPAILEAAKNSIPLKRMGAPEDISRIVTYLCSEEANYITGQVIAVNGGLGM